MDVKHESPPKMPPSPENNMPTSGTNTQARSEEDFAQHVSDIEDYQLTHGNLIKLVGFEQPTRVPAIGTAVSAFPTSFPRRLFDAALELQQCMSELYIRVASDPNFLHTIFEPLLQHDKLLAALWEIYIKVELAGVAQDVVCGIFRSDYMLHKEGTEVSLKQVEMNHTCVAGACHAQSAAGMYAHLNRVREVANPAPAASPVDLPTNANISSIVRGLQTAHRAYIGSTSHLTCLVMLVQPDNFNVADERPLEYGLWEVGIPCYRCEWQKLTHRTRLTPDRTLLYRPSGAQLELEVSVIYYRAGYDLVEYDPPGKEIRLRLELSRAIKCPDILTHLSTFKVVQAALARPGQLENFFPDSPSTVARIRSTFMPMYTYESFEFRNVAMSSEEAEHYVLKPNRDGGGNNIYRSDIPPALANVPQEEWKGYVLQRIIEPPKDIQGVLLTAEDVYSGPVISELGVLGTCMWRKRKGGELEVMSNELAGWTFKTKPRGIDEMSVVKGYGCFDCPKLVD